MVLHVLPWTFRIGEEEQMSGTIRFNFSFEINELKRGITDVRSGMKNIDLQPIHYVTVLVSVLRVKIALKQSSKHRCGQGVFGGAD